MVNEHNMNLALNRLVALRKTIPVKDIDVEKAFFLFQQMHIYRLMSVSDAYFIKEDPSYRSMSNDLEATSGIYIAPIWSLNNNDSFKQFRTYLVEKCKDKKLDIEKCIGIIPGLVTGTFSPKEAKIINSETMMKLSGVELLFCNKMTAKVKNNLIAV